VTLLTIHLNFTIASDIIKEETTAAVLDKILHVQYFNTLTTTATFNFLFHWPILVGFLINETGWNTTFTDQTPFMSPNQQHQSAVGIFHALR